MLLCIIDTRIFAFIRYKYELYVSMPDAKTTPGYWYRDCLVRFSPRPWPCRSELLFIIRTLKLGVIVTLSLTLHGISIYTQSIL